MSGLLESGYSNYQVPGHYAKHIGFVQVCDRFQRSIFPQRERCQCRTGRIFRKALVESFPNILLNYTV